MPYPPAALCRGLGRAYTNSKKKKWQFVIQGDNMKKIFLILLIPFAAYADTCHLEQVGGGDWRIVCEGSGLVYNYVDVTNEVYVIQDCENLKTSLLSSVLSINSDAEAVYDSRIPIEDSLRDLTLEETIETNQVFITSYNTIYQNLEFMAAKLEGVIDNTSPSGSIDNLYYTISNIECVSCPTNGASGGGSGGSCCDVDFTDIINRLIVAEQQRAAISNQIESIFYYLGVFTNEIAYSNFLLEHGFGEITNMLNYAHWDTLPYSTFNPSTGLNSLYGLRTLSHGTNFSVGQLPLNTISANARDNGWLPSIWWQNFDQLKIMGSLNSFELNKYLNYHGPVTNNLISLNKTLDSLTDSTTNFFSFFRGELGVRGVLEDWQSEEVSGSYYDFLTNHYLSVVFGESLSGYQAEKTNWFSRIETLLAALVFVDGSETNAYASATDASTNSVDNIKDSFNSTFDGVSSAPSTQMELAVDIEKSMYNSLKSFSQAFSSASLPSTVRLLYVYKDDGGGGGSLRKGALRSSGGSVDVSVDVDGKLSDFIEILRSCSTLCWVFFGLWFMFKFAVWTVKKIYFLIRYIIDFFNMVAGGK